MIGSKIFWHQGIASVATFCESKGHIVDLLELYETNNTALDNAISVFNPDVIAFTANSHQVPYVKNFISYIKNEYSHVFVILGGVAVTIDPESVINQIDADAFCRGEGEAPFVQYLEKLDSGFSGENYKLPNFSYKKNINPCTYFVENLDSLPIARRSLFSFYRNADKSENLPFGVRFLFCRGCPFNCTYCCNKGLKDFFPSIKNYVRWPSPERAVEEIALLSDQFKFNSFVIDDDIFTLDNKWTQRFCEVYPNNLKDKKFEVNIRIGTVTLELLKALKDCGCNLVKMGLESGDEKIRENVLNRKITNEMIKDTVDMIRKAGLDIHTFNMVGIPGETHASVIKTIRINRYINPKRLQVTIFYPYKNTQLGESCIKKGSVSSIEDSYFKKKVIKHENLSAVVISMYAKFFKLFVYFGISRRKTFNELRTIAGSFLRDIPFGDQVIYYLKKFTIKK